MTPAERHEWLVCAESPAYLIHTYVVIYDATTRTWLPLHLWPAQVRVLRIVQQCQHVILLKARQIGMTWLVLAYALWMVLFQPGSTILLFSRRDDEAVDLLDFRLKGMFIRLPAWLRRPVAIVTDNNHQRALSSGSRALAFPPNAGDSYTATMAIIDEADLIPDLDRLMGSVEPTINAGGKLVLLSRPDKRKPTSPFKAMYRAAKTEQSSYTPIFLPWSARPGRDAAWYAAQQQQALTRPEGLDQLYEQYPATDAEALAPRQLDKRLAAAWLTACYRERPPITFDGAPALGSALRLYAAPVAGRRYTIGADPAEGNPTSDPSAATVVDAATGDEVASLAGQLEPAVFAAHLATLARTYGAGVLVERINHGHAVLLWLRDNAPDVQLIAGVDERPGWLSSSRGKALLYDAAAENLQAGDAGIATFTTYVQLASIEGSSLRAPTGEHDDHADSWALAQIARRYLPQPVAAPAVGGERPAYTPQPRSPIARLRGRR